MALESLRIAARALAARKLRSALTVVSIAVGAGSIVTMTSLARSGQATLERGFAELGGARLIDIGAKAPERSAARGASYFGGLTERDADAIAAAAPHVSAHAMFAVLTPAREVAGDGGGTHNGDLVAGDAGLIDLFHLRVAHGRRFSQEENRSRAGICVVGDKLAAALWPGAAADHLGRRLSVGAVHCRVVGELAAEERFGMNLGFDARNVVIAPLATVAAVDHSAMQRAELILETDDERHNEIVKRIANALLMARHHGVDDFQLFDFRKMVERFHRMFTVMEIIVGAIAAIALLVGGFGVMNMMLVSVSERVREIGVRKAVGAAPRDIAAQFIAEAVLLAGVGGTAGALGGVLVALAAGALIGLSTASWIIVVSAPAVALATGAAAAIGVVFGWLPARSGARLPAVEAMRR